MNQPKILTLEAAKSLVVEVLLANNTSAKNASSVAQALVSAEADGQAGHGLSRVPSYAAQTKSGKVNGSAVPDVKQVAPAVLNVDAQYGFSYPAIDVALEGLSPLAQEMGVAIAAIHHSHHFGQAGAHAERLADRGLVALVFGNSPKAMAFYGGKRAKIGTNPIAFAAPLAHAPPLVIDLALSEAARGKVVAAQKTGDIIPGHWAKDEHGQATTDPAAALKGTMTPIGGAKGAALALMVEVLSAALTASFFGFEASSLFDAEGAAPNLGQTILAIDPSVTSQGAFFDRMSVLSAEIDAEQGARWPGVSRLRNRALAAQHGLTLPYLVYADMLAARGE